MTKDNRTTEGKENLTMTDNRTDENIKLDEYEINYIYNLLRGLSVTSHQEIMMISSLLNRFKRPITAPAHDGKAVVCEICKGDHETLKCSMATVYRIPTPDGKKELVELDKHKLETIIIDTWEVSDIGAERIAEAICERFGTQKKVPSVEEIDKIIWKHCSPLYEKDIQGHTHTLKGDDLAKVIVDYLEGK